MIIRSGLGVRQIRFIRIYLSFERSNENYVVIASGDAIYKMDYRKIIEYHKEKEADITVVCKTNS